MLIRLGASRTNTIDRHLAGALAAIAGALNAVAFYAVGFFSANMTGNVSTLSDHLALGQWRSACFYGAIVFVFIMGSVVSTLFISAGRRRKDRSIYAKTILIEAALLAVLGLAAAALPPDWRASSLVLGLAFLMGLQNATVTRISEARVRTTHVSGMVTDIGIELALLFDIARGKTPAVDRADVGGRLRLHLETVVAFLIGGIIGLLFYRFTGIFVLWIAAMILAALALPALLEARRAHSGDESPLLPNDL